MLTEVCSVSHFCLVMQRSWGFCVVCKAQVTRWEGREVLWLSSSWHSTGTATTLNLWNTLPPQAWLFCTHFIILGSTKQFPSEEYSPCSLYLWNTCYHWWEQALLLHLGWHCCTTKYPRSFLTARDKLA